MLNEPGKLKEMGVDINGVGFEAENYLESMDFTSMALAKASNFRDIGVARRFSGAYKSAGLPDRRNCRGSQPRP